MEKNHDMMKAASLTKIRKSCGTILIFAILFLVIELISRPLQLLYTVQMQKKLGADGHLYVMDYLNAFRFGSVPVQIVRAVLMIASVVILIALFVRIRKSESPFQEQYGKILQIIAVLQGIIPFLENIEQIILRAQDGTLYIENILFLFRSDSFSYWLLANAVMLFFLGRMIRYGAGLQQASDETL